MALSRIRKVTIILLVLYWPAFFILAHIPVPGLVRKAGVSDKSLHFLAYLILVFLLWFAVSGDKKVNWRRAGVWWVFLVVLGYGIVDELLQGVVGRNCDVKDMVADLAGTLAGLILFSIFSFWPAALLVAAAVIFGITNIARANLAELVPVAYAIFHLFAYAIFTMLWIQYMHLSLSLKPPKLKWLLSALAGPMGLLLTVKLFSIALGKVLELQEIIISVVALLAVVVTTFLMTLSHKAKDAKDMVQS
ncbi:MAG: VanZ family protein [Sedimentisphaerales bacterium]|nr:VanZ family protein [Sedimentisphaerales bacterium]